MEIEDHGDGTWSYLRADGVAVGDRATRGPVVWEYQGQVDFSSTPEPVGERWVEEEAGWEDWSAEGHLLGTSRVDAAGGEWLAVEVDADALAARVDDNRAALAVAAGVDVTDEIFDVPDLEWVEGGTWWWEPESWTTVDCSSPSITYHLHDGDDDRQRSTSLTDRQKTAALVVARLGTSGHNYCGGAFLQTGSVLTAAHCLMDDSGLPVPKGKITVCSQGNAYSGADCAGALDVTYDPDYVSGTWTPAHDLAVIALPTIDGHGYMWVAGYSDSYVKSIDQHNIAFPFDSPPASTCTSNTRTGVADRSLTGFYLSHQMEAIHTHILTGAWHTDFDGGHGHSGSPFYFCGDDWCDTGDHAYVTGVWSGWSWLYSTHWGAKTNTHATWILGVM